MSRAIRHAARAFTPLASGSVCCDVCHNSGARYSAKDGKTLCKAHRAEQRLMATKLQRKLARAKVLLAATLDMLTQAENAHFVESPLEMVMHYDEADCDGSCLKDDIEDFQRMPE